MPKKMQKWLKISAAIILTAFLLTIGGGFYRDLSANSDETYQELKVFTSVIEELEKNYVDPVDTEKLIKAAIKGMVQSLDPHSQFLPPDAFEELQTDTKGEFEGLGIVITMPKGILKVISPIEGTPAARAGIKPGDIIYKIDGAPTADMELWEAVKRMRGKKGTTVELTIIRKSSAEELHFELTRDVIPIISVKFITVKPGYGYIWITNFQSNTTEELLTALNSLKKESQGKLQGLILDLRNNPGGLLDQAISISDLFLEDGQILSVKERNDEQTYYAHRNKTKRDFPIVVLINGGSASASEIVAGALQDHDRALVLGMPSFGKGSVQTVKPLGDNSGIKFTIARYYTPAGRSIQAKGITPDIEVPHQIDEPPENTEKQLLKEIDLKNHLEAQPQADPPPSEEKQSRPEEKTPPEGEKEAPEDLQQSKYGDIELSALLRDSQVQRALDALISYQIFQKMGKAGAAAE